MGTHTKAVLYGAPIGVLGGLIGLGGAEFRLPVLKASFGRPTHQAVALNLAVSLLTLVASLAIRIGVAAPARLADWAVVVVALITGSMVGAYTGAAYASRIRAERLEQLVLTLLVGIGLILIAEGFYPLHSAGITETPVVRVPVGLVLGAAVGIVSSVLGVAGGEIIIPILVLVFGASIKDAGTLSVMISLPTVGVGIARYWAAYDRNELRNLVLPMGVGSIVGAFAGGYLVPYVSSAALKVALGVILIVSAVRIFRAH